MTGPTGSGKTTTLYASLRQIDKQLMNISTVEDPVEYNLAGITQIQMHEKIGMTFARALKALLRQDPDVVMVGEIRDQETANTAIQAALTGHLVLSTLHTNDAPSSITRLINIGLEPFLVGRRGERRAGPATDPRLCLHCKKMGKPSEDMAEFLAMHGSRPGLLRATRPPASRPPRRLLRTARPLSWTTCSGTSSRATPMSPSSGARASNGEWSRCARTACGKSPPAPPP